MLRKFVFTPSGLVPHNMAETRPAKDYNRDVRQAVANNVLPDDVRRQYMDQALARGQQHMDQMRNKTISIYQVPITAPVRSTTPRPTTPRPTTPRPTTPIEPATPTGRPRTPVDEATPEADTPVYGTPGTPVTPTNDLGRALKLWTRHAPDAHEARVTQLAQLLHGRENFALTNDGGITFADQMIVSPVEALGVVKTLYTKVPHRYAETSVPMANLLLRVRDTPEEFRNAFSDLIINPQNSRFIDTGVRVNDRWPEHLTEM